jgi:hypothetical protein
VVATRRRRCVVIRWMTMYVRVVTVLAGIVSLAIATGSGARWT